MMDTKKMQEYFEPKGAAILIYKGKGEFEKAVEFHPNLGTSEFMEKYYFHYSSYPSNECLADCSLFSIYSLKSEFSEKLPQYVIDLQFDEGDILCFNFAWQVVEYINSMVPLISLHLDK